MISLKFPSLEKLLVKNIAELDDDDAKAGVCIACGHAIVVMEKSMLFFDLADYFVVTGGITDNNIIKELNQVLDFMEGKMFSAMFWKELTSTNQVSISEEGLSLDGVIRKDLYYREKIFDQTEIKMVCNSIVKSEKYLKEINSIYLEPLFSLMSGIKPLVKDDTIILRTVGENTQIQFTFNENPWIYGVLSIDAAVNTKNFLFDSLKGFSEEIMG